MRLCHNSISLFGVHVIDDAQDTHAEVAMGQSWKSFCFIESLQKQSCYFIKVFGYYRRLRDHLYYANFMNAVGADT